MDFLFNSLSFFKTNSLDADFFCQKKGKKHILLHPSSSLFPLTQVLKDVITKRTLAIEKRVLADVEALKTQVCELEAQKIQLQCDSERLKQTLKEISTKQEKVRWSCLSAYFRPTHDQFPVFDQLQFFQHREKVAL